MRNSIVKACLLVASVCAAPAMASADSYICAIGEVFECAPVIGCKRAALRDVNIATFMLLDLEKKQLTSGGIGRDERTEDVEGLKVTEKAIFVHGTQDVETWNAVISLENGALSGSISNADSSLAIFGNCTKK